METCLAGGPACGRPAYIYKPPSGGEPILWEPVWWEARLHLQTKSFSRHDLSSWEVALARARGRFDRLRNHHIRATLMDQCNTMKHSDRAGLKPLQGSDLSINNASTSCQKIDSTGRVWHCEMPRQTPCNPMRISSTW